MARTDYRMEEPYWGALFGILRFSSFAEAERTIKRLEDLCRNYEEASDKKGVEYCRRIAFLGRRRAEIISRNRRVCTEKRLQKQEIAAWFKIWLETPAIFSDWLLMRKNTEAFRELLASECLNHPKSGGRNAGAKIP